jgi:hypothetical protein
MPGYRCSDYLRTPQPGLFLKRQIFLKYNLGLRAKKVLYFTITILSDMVKYKSNGIGKSNADTEFEICKIN